MLFPNCREVLMERVLKFSIRAFSKGHAKRVGTMPLEIILSSELDLLHLVSSSHISYSLASIDNKEDMHLSMDFCFRLIVSFVLCHALFQYAYSHICVSMVSIYNS